MSSSDLPLELSFAFGGPIGAPDVHNFCAWHGIHWASIDALVSDARRYGVASVRFTSFEDLETVRGWQKELDEVLQLLSYPHEEFIVRAAHDKPLPDGENLSYRDEGGWLVFVYSRRRIL